MTEEKEDTEILRVNEGGMRNEIGSADLEISDEGDPRALLRVNSDGPVEITCETVSLSPGEALIPASELRELIGEWREQHLPREGSYRRAADELEGLIDE